MLSEALKTARQENASGTAGPAGRLLALIVRTGASACALPMENVMEIMRPLPIQPVSGMPFFVRGLSIIRGTPVPVVDLSALMGVGQGGPSRRYALLRIDKRQVALAVEEVLGIHELDPSLLRELPPLLREAHPDLISALGALDQRLLLMLQTAQIVPEAVWQALAAREIKSS